MARITVIKPQAVPHSLGSPLPNAFGPRMLFVVAVAKLAVAIVVVSCVDVIIVVVVISGVVVVLTVLSCCLSLLGYWPRRLA